MNRYYLIASIAIFLLISIGIYIVYSGEQKNRSQSNQTSNTQIFALMDNIYKIDERYLIDLKKVDFLSVDQCEALRLDSPSGFCLANELPAKQYTATSTTIYRAMTHNEDGWGADMKNVTMSEFYDNYVGNSNSIIDKSMFFRNKSELGLFKIYTDSSGNISIIEGIYTP